MSELDWAARVYVHRAHPRASGTHPSERPAHRLEQLKPDTLKAQRVSARRSLLQLQRLMFREYGSLYCTSPTNFWTVRAYLELFLAS